MSWKEWNGREVIAKFSDEVSDAVFDAAGEMKAQILREIPHDDGHLEDTVIVLKDPQNKLLVEIGAGGGGASGYPVVPYAVRWHEETANFQKGRKSQYMRDPLKQVLPKAIDRQMKKRGLK